MRKYGLIAAILGFGLLGLDFLLREKVNLSLWAWLAGAALTSGGAALFLAGRWASAAPAVPTPKAQPRPGPDTARLLDNFEQRFAELKGRKGSDTVLGDLYTLGAQLEQRGRGAQATAVYRHLARIDNTYRDVGARLRRLLDTERAKSKSVPMARSAPACRRLPPRPRRARGRARRGSEECGSGGRLAATRTRRASRNGSAATNSNARSAAGRWASSIGAATPLSTAW